MSKPVVIDASAFVELLLRDDLGRAVGRRLRGHDLHAPAHFDAEVLSALGRLHRDGRLTPGQVGAKLGELLGMPVDRHPVQSVVLGAWRRRRNLRLTDALYVELAEHLDATLVTTDRRLARSATVAELVAPQT